MESLTLQVKSARERKDEAEAALTAANKAVAASEAKLAEEMANQGMSSVRTAHGHFVFGGMKRYHSFKKETKDQALELIREMAPDLVREQVNTKSLDAWIKGEKEATVGDNAKPLPSKWEELLACLTWYDKPAIQVRR
jgi:hypothetical protein